MDQPSPVEELLKRLLGNMGQVDRSIPPLPSAMRAEGPQTPPQAAAGPQEPVPPPAMPTPPKTSVGDDPPAMPTPHRTSVEADPPTFDRPAATLQSMTSLNYSPRTPPAIESLKIAARSPEPREDILGKMSPREADEPASFKDMPRSRSTEISDAGPEAGDAGLKDAINQLKESIDKLRDTIKDQGVRSQSNGAPVKERSSMPVPDMQPSQGLQTQRLGGYDQDVVRGARRSYTL
jgi:hypothetical protein